MPAHASSAARSEYARIGLITPAQSIEACSRLSLTSSSAGRRHVPRNPTPKRVRHGAQRYFSGQQQGAKPCRPTTFAAAEPIAFARTDATEPEEEDFYSILGVAYNADEGQIKKAYYAIMRECHPDTLKHPERRAAYDAIVGLSGDAVNPFTDTSYERDQMEPDFGRARAMAQKVDNDEMLQESLDCCPVDCIHWVTAPQLSLLENSMSKLERTNVHLLNTHGGNRGGVNVFLEASIAWEKRQAGIRARRHAAESQARWAKWGASNGVATGAAAKAGREEPGPEPRGSKADTASAAARAARRWRDLQRMKRNNADRLMLSSLDD